MKHYEIALEEKIWCIKNLSVLIKRDREMVCDLFVVQCGEDKVMKVTDILPRTENLMLEQFEYEETAVLCGKQLCYSEYFKVFITKLKLKFNKYKYFLFYFLIVFRIYDEMLKQ